MLKKVLASIGIFLLIVYLGGAFLFMGRYGFNTYVDGRSVFFKTPGEVSLELIRRTKNRTVSFVARDGSTETLTFEQMGAYRPAESDITWAASSSLGWPVTLIKRTSYDLDPEVRWDESKMMRALRTLDMVRNGKTDPVDAKVVRQDDGSFSITPEIEGTRVDVDKLAATVGEAIQGSGPYEIDLAAMDCYVAPALRAGDGRLLVARDGANELKNLKINLDLGAGLEVQVPTDVLVDCYDLTGSSEAGVRPEGILDYVHVLQETYDTYGKDRTFHTSTGDDVIVSPRSQGPCDFAGWQLDENALYEELLKAFSGGKDCSVTVPWEYKGVDHGEMNDFGTTYLEISLRDQHMWLYDNGTLVADTDVVTGNTSKGWDTPTGIFVTTDFYTEFTMHGSYGTAFCHYFIRLTLDGVGVHDSNRSAFGGSIYKTNGSHGCINTPYAKEKAIFEFLYNRQYSGERRHTPVIVWDAA